MDPYRSSTKIDATDATEAPPPRSAMRELLVPFALLWLLSLARVVATILARRAFDAHDTLAIVTLVLLPRLYLGRPRRSTPR